MAGQSVFTEIEMYLQDVKKSIVWMNFIRRSILEVRELVFMSSLGSGEKQLREKKYEKGAIC